MSSLGAVTSSFHTNITRTQPVQRPLPIVPVGPTGGTKVIQLIVPTSTSVGNRVNLSV